MSKTLLPFRYAGGKFYALKLLRPFWKAVEHDEYREPMVGGASVFFTKRPAKYNWLNDIDPNLMTTYRVMADPRQRMQLVKRVTSEVASPERHKEVQDIEPESDLDVAFKYFYLNRTSFSGKMASPSWGYRPKRSLPPERWHERINPCGERLESVTLTNLDYSKVIEAPKSGSSVLMFVDPPYFKPRQNSHYAYSFDQSEHEKLAGILRRTKHNFFLTYDDCDEVRELYDWAEIHPLEFVYRIDNSQARDGKRKWGSEIVITNYSIESYKTTRLTEQVPKREELPLESSIQSPFRYPGSKGRAVKLIRPYWETAEHDEYREPFFGGGAVFFSKPKAKVNWINDIDKDLITTLQIMADSTMRRILIGKVTSETATRKRHSEVKSWTPTEPLDIAYRYYYLNRTSYSGIMKKPAWGYHTKKSVPPHRWGPRVEKAGRKLEGVKITAMDFEDVISADATGESVFLFLDPPYYASDQKRAYENSFTQEDHMRLCKRLKKTSYNFCLTYDDCEEVRDIYSWANIDSVSWRYHTANARKATRKLG
ncbi:MAG: DNA adenine methylase, partial [Candidatus Thorarchaeota archaeon]